jgi:hypothetical protein
MPARLPARASRRRVPALTHDPSSLFQPPEEVGPFRVRRVLASGTLGPRLLVEDERGRLQVLKLITEVAGDGPVLAEHLERVRLALPQHPALLPLTEVGLSDEGVYLASPVVTAPTVEGRLRGGRQSLEATLPWLRPITAGMQAAHDAGVWHGAIHPRDVLVTDDGGMLTGVGLAPVLESLDMQAPVRVPFTAPERASGRPWDARADQYSLAMLALDALSGRRLIAGTIPAFDRWTLAETPTEDARLHEVFVRALHPDPDKRFPSVEAWLTALAGDEPTAEAAGALSRFAREGVILAAPAGEAPREIAVQPIEDPEGVALSLFPEEEGAPTPSATPGGTAAAVDDEEVEQEWLVADVPSDAHDHDPLVLRTPDEHVGASASGASSPVWRLDDHDAPGATDAWTPDAQESPSRRAWLLLAVLLAVAAAGYGTWRSLQAPGPGTQASTSSPVEPEPVSPSADPSGPPQGLPAERQPQAAPAPVPPAAVVPQTPVTPRVVPPRQAPPAATAEPAPAPPQPPTVATGRVLIRSSPSAEVRVNGAVRGETPVVLRDLPLGPYTVTISRPGFVPVERQVVLAAAQPVASMSIDLVRQDAAAPTVQPARPVPAPARPPAPAAPTAQAAPPEQGEADAPRTGGIFVVSTPAQARLTIDGQYYGSTPASVPGLSQGAHTVRVEAPGFKPWEGRVAVIAGTRVRVQATLQQEQE